MASIWDGYAQGFTMSLLSWSKEYDIGITEVDNQHMRLMELTNRLHDALVEKRHEDEVGEILEELVEYTRVHFAVEECLQRLFAHEGYEAHKAVHDRIVVQVTGMHQRYRAGDVHVGMELLLFLKDWLFEHISKVDKDYVPAFTRKKMRSWRG